MSASGSLTVLHSIVFDCYICIYIFNVQETVEVNPTPQPEVTGDSDTPPSGDVVVEETPSQPADEPPPEAEGGDATSADVGGAETDEGGEGEKLDLEGGGDQPQEAQDDMQVGSVGENFNRNVSCFVATTYCVIQSISLGFGSFFRILES